MGIPSDFGFICVFFASLVIVAHGQIPKAFKVTYSETRLEVGIDKTTLLVHDVNNPMLFIGKGETEISEVTGNYVIKEYLDSKIPLPFFSVEENEITTRITFAASPVSEVSMTLELSTTSSHKLSVSFSQYPCLEHYDRTWFRVYAQPDEHVYGGGEQFSYFDLRGRNYPIWVREQGVGRNKSHPIKYVTDTLLDDAGGDYHTTYFPQASYVSSRKYYGFVQGTTYMDLNFRHPDFHEITIHGLPESVHFETGDSMLRVVQNVADYFGHQPVLPEWLSTGTVIGLQGGTERMLSILNNATENGISVSALWIQDWCGTNITPFGKRVYWNWEWNPKHYPGLDKEIRRLRDEKGVRLLAYITGHVTVNGSIYNSGKGKDYFMKNQAGEEYLVDFGDYWCATVDLTNPEARKWYKGVITTNLIEFGFGGWMADFGEYIPHDSVFYNGETGAMMHNKFSVLWAQLNREAVEEAGKLGEIMFFMRSGGPGTQRYSVNTWAGDQNVDWSYSDGLASTVPAALSFGMSGFGLTHFDIGGYTTMQIVADFSTVFVNFSMVRSEELFFRGAEYAVFTPTMRTHEGNRPTLNFQVYNSNVTMRRFARIVRMFRALSSYTRAAMEENTARGVPVQRPLLLHYESDATTYTVGHQYLLGRDLLVAPVLEPGVSSWRLYLPRDEWRYLYDDTYYSGGEWVTVPAPLGKPPVFYRSGSVWRDTFKQVADIANEEDATEAMKCGDGQDNCS